MLTADHEMIDRRILQEARSLMKLGHSVKLLAGFECATPESYLVDGIEIERFQYDWSDARADRIANRLGADRGHRLYPPFLKGFRYLAKLSPALDSFEYYVYERAIEQSFDLIHVHDFPMLRPGLKVAKARRVPIIYDTHEFYPHQVQFSNKLRASMLRQERLAIRQVDAVITVNEHIGCEIAKAYGIPQPTIIYNAVPLEDVEPYLALREELGVDAQTRLLLYQGWLSENRGIETLVDMMVGVDSAHLVVVGYGDYLSELKQRATRLNLNDRVSFMGRRELEELQQITAACDLGIIPYHGVDLNNHFCSPNKLFEFVMAKLPYVCNELPFLQSVIERYGCGQALDLSNSSAAGEALEELLSSGERIALLKQGCERARQALNWEQAEQTLYGLYETVTENGSLDR